MWLYKRHENSVLCDRITEFWGEKVFFLQGLATFFLYIFYLVFGNFIRWMETWCVRLKWNVGFEWFDWTELQILRQRVFHVFGVFLLALFYSCLWSPDSGITFSTIYNLIKRFGWNQLANFDIVNQPKSRYVVSIHCMNLDWAFYSI